MMFKLYHVLTKYYFEPFVCVILNTYVMYVYVYTVFKYHSPNHISGTNDCQTTSCWFTCTLHVSKQILTNPFQSDSCSLIQFNHQLSIAIPLPRIFINMHVTALSLPAKIFTAQYCLITLKLYLIKQFMYVFITLLSQ
jgi:uncharacterized membrane protein